MGAADLAPSIFVVLRDLATNPSTAVVEALRNATSAATDQVARITQEAQAIVNQAAEAAEGAQAALQTRLVDAQAELASVAADFEDRIAAAESAVTDAVTRGQGAVAAAQQQAQQLRAGALASTVEATERLAIEQRAEQLVSESEQLAAQLEADAQRVVADLNDAVTARQEELQAAVASLTDEVTRAVERVTELVAASQQRLEDEVARLTAAAQQVAALVTALPGQAIALAEDARRQVAGVLEQQASLLGVLTRTLVYLKDELFPDEQRLQIVTYSDANAPSPGVGLSWVDGDVKALLAYAPDLGGPLGSVVVQTSRPDGGPIDIAAGSPVQIGLKASGSQSAVITLGAPVAPTGEFDVECFADFDTSTLRLDERFLQAEVGTPHLSVRIRFVGGVWRYKAAGSLSDAAWDVDFARLLAPIPNLFPLPEFGESRTFAVALEDGVFTYVETDAA